MNRIDKLFSRKQSDILSIYFTGGFPHRDSTVDIIKALADGGIDMIEVGVPFSDPMADGPVIQESSTIALRNGMNLHLLLDQVEEARRTVTEIPMVLMGYLNPMMQYGIEPLFKRCKEAGIDALIIPDLPFHEYMRDIRELCRKYDLPMIMLITPETSDERIKLIDENCDGFIYMVSAAATTGTRDSFGEAQLDYFRHVNSLDLSHKRLIGFGISNPSTLGEAFTYASGAIIGSLFIKCLGRTSSPAEAVSLLKSTIGIA
ncbi:MAG: tryptophan synthase subunit alpha [Duncaniella sp.]|uniref:tryptophan synthase subunit alpha n=1 Tax=Duncaniella sp. TaxID=2518496 RepID=UPI0023D02F53|nr:tryptophan synthase subunit alpha [Duncaniella sp.]MDE6089936.1 tryptophan synthase subunit alpha [Duncaniella sp.]